MRTYSMVTDQGTAMAEATLCEEHYTKPFISFARWVAGGADDIGSDLTFHDSTGNDAVRCVECGRGSDA